MSIDFGNWAFRNNKLVYFLIAVLVIGGAYSAYEMSKLEDPELKVKLAMVAATAYANVIRAKELHKVQLQYNDLLEELLQTVRKAEAAGMSDRNDVLKVEVKVNEGALNLKRTENAVRIAKMNLCHYIGYPLDSEVDVAESSLPESGSVSGSTDISGRYAIVVALSSNPSSVDFQTAEKGGKPLYQVVMEKMMEISTPENMMFVVGATKADKLKEIRQFCPDNFFLVPGVGAQGGSAEEVIANGSNSQGGLLINSSRGVLYASSGEDFAEAAAAVAARTATL